MEVRRGVRERERCESNVPPASTKCQPLRLAFFYIDVFLMDQSRILMIGQAGSFRTSLFGNPPNLAEFGAVIWYPKSIIVEWQQSGAGSTPERLSKLLEWIKKGNTLVIVGAPKYTTGTYIKDTKQYNIDILKSEIFEGVAFRATSGFLIEYNGPQSLADAISPFANLLSYDAILESKDLVPLFRVSTALEQIPRKASRRGFS